MKKNLSLLLSICALLMLPSCAREAPREPDPRDISPENVAYIILSVDHSPTVAIEDPALIAELTGSVNGLRSELGVYDDEPRSHSYPHFAFSEPEEKAYRGHVVLYGEFGEELAHVDFYGGGFSGIKAYRDNYRYSDQRSILFDLELMESIGAEMPEGVSPVTELWFECMWGAEKIWVEDTRTGKTAVTSDKELIDRLNDHFIGLIFRVDEPCGEDASYRYKVRWTYLETDELLEYVEVWDDGRIQRNGNWCTPLNGPIDTGLLAEVFEKPDK